MANDDKVDTQSSIDVGGAAGSTVKALYRERKMKCYLVTDSDLSHLSLANWAVTALAALGSFCMSQALQIGFSSAFTTELTAEGKILTVYAKPLLVIFALIFFGLAAGAHFWRVNQIGIIKRESGE